MVKKTGIILNRKKRMLTLALVMAALVSIVSFFSTLVLSYTSLQEQQALLSEIANSHISLIETFDQMHRGGVQDGLSSLEHMVAHIASAHEDYTKEGGRAVFSLAQFKDDKVRYLIVQNAMQGSFKNSKLFLTEEIPAPMRKALGNHFGRSIEVDQNGQWIVVAYGPIKTRYGSLGIVVSVTLFSLLQPFLKAMIISLLVGGVMVLVGLYLFYRVSDPMLRALEKSEEQYRELVEGANSIIVRVQRGGFISLANQYAHDFLGIEELEGCSANETLVSANSTENIFDFSKNHWEEETIEAVVVRGNGVKARISWTVRPLVGKDGEVNELLCIGVDITPRYLAQQARREMEERFRGIAKASPVGIVITDAQGNLVYANEKMHEMTRSDAAEMAGQGWLQRIHADDRKAMRAFWVGKMNTQVQRRVEFRLLQGPRGVLWVLVQRVQLGDNTSTDGGYVLTFTDITRLKEVETQHLRLAAAIEQSVEMVIITDVAGHIQYVNPAFERVTGYSRQEVLGAKPSLLKSGEQDHAFYKEMWQTILGGEVWRGRLVNKRKDESTYEQECTIAPVRESDGTIVNFVAVARDATEKLALEAQLRQAQKLESIGELAAGIAHEINTPTQYVDSNLRFLKTSFSTLMDMVNACLAKLDEAKNSTDGASLAGELEEILNKEELEFLSEDIPNAVDDSLDGLQRVAGIVRSVKQLAHPGESMKSMYDMNEIIHNAVTVSTNEWKYISNMILELDEDIPEVYCLKSQMSQVLLNLIVNAAHAVEAALEGRAEDKGDIHIRTRAEGEFVVVEVEDSGTGMPDAVVARIFDPFFTTKDVGKGTGQGLAIAHNVVVLGHGGSIDVRTREGEGTTFILHIPKEAREGENPANSV